MSQMVYVDVYSYCYLNEPDNACNCQTPLRWHSKRAVHRINISVINCECEINAVFGAFTLIACV